MGVAMDLLIPNCINPFINMIDVSRSANHHLYPADMRMHVCFDRKIDFPRLSRFFFEKEKHVLVKNMKYRSGKYLCM